MDVDRSQLPDIELLTWALRGDVEAVDFNMRLHKGSHAWDDVHDGHNAQGDENVDVVLFDLFAQLPHHPFVKRYPMLWPVVASAMMTWMSGNRLEKTGDERALQASYMLRWNIFCVTQYCAFLLGGVRWATEVGEALWMHKTREPYAQYLEEHHGPRG